MKRNGGFRKIRYFATLGLSTVALAIASLSTFAWFQINATSTDPNNTFSAGSSDFSIQSVDGLKSVRQIDASGYQTVSGDERSISRQSATAASTSNTGNTTKETDFDVPEQGVGYYVVFSSSDYKYAGGYKMETNDDLQNNDDKLTLKNVKLTAGEFFDIRRHYFKSDTKMADEYVTEISSVYGGSSTAIETTRQTDEAHGNSSHWKVKTTGDYDIYVTSGNQLYVTSVSSFSEQVNADSVKEEAPKNGGAQKKNAGPTKKNANGDNTNYYVVGDIKINGSGSSLGWNTTSSARMKVAADNTAAILQLNVTGTGGYKVRNGDSWYPGGGNLNISSAGYYDIFLNNSTVYTSPSYGYLPNSVTGWNPPEGCGITLSRSYDNTAELFNSAVDLSADTEFKFYYDGGWYGWAKRKTGEGSAIQLEWIGEGSDGNFKVASGHGGRYSIYCKTANKDNGAGENGMIWIAPVQYTVTLNRQSGTGGDSSVTVHYGTSTSSISVPTRSGYTFGGYYTQTGGGGTKYYNADGSAAKSWDIADDTTLYAKWTAINYSITYYNTTGASWVSASGRTHPTSYTVATATITLADMEKTGYTFGGWYGNSGLTGAQITTIANGSTGNKTLYAKWTAHTYTVKFDENNSTEGRGGSTASVTATYGQDRSLTTNGFTRPGYSFDGWNTERDGSGDSYVDSGTIPASKINTYYGTVGNEGTLTLYAQWSRRFTVTLDDDGGSGGSGSVSATYGYAMPAVSKPTFTNYTFGGYYTQKGGNGDPYYDSTPSSASNWDIDAATTLYAKWTMTGTITLEKKGGSGGTGSVTSQVYHHAMNSITAPTKTGYTFAGYWTSENDETGTMYYNSSGASAAVWAGGGGSTTLYAHWTPISYEVRFNKNDNGATGTMSNQSFTYDEAQNLTANGFSKTGYTFAGWATSTSGDVVYDDQESVKNLTTTANAVVDLYAKWTANTYEVEFDANGGTGSMSNQGYTYDGSDTALDKNTYTKSGYTFIGWNTDPHGGGTSYGNEEEVSNLTSVANGTVTLYAQWQGTSITLSQTGATTAGTTSIANPIYNGALSSIMAPARTGYTFQGYYTSTGGGGNKVFNADGSVNTAYNSGYWLGGGSDTLYAYWTANTYTVTLDMQSGSGGTSSVTATYDSAMPSASAPTRTGYDFQGYYASTGGSGICYYDKNMVSQHNWDQASNTRIYAYWTESVYTVTLNVNGGTINAGNVTSYTYGTGATLPTNVTRTGYTFDGWFTASSGGSKVTSISTSATGDKEYWAHWTAEQYTMTFNCNGGSINGSSTSTVTFTYDSAIPSLGDGYYIPYRAGYAFAGWYYDGNEPDTLCYGAFNDRATVDDKPLVWTTDLSDVSKQLTAHWASLTLTSPTNDIYAIFEGGSGTPVMYVWSEYWTYYVAMSAVDGYSNVYKATVPTGYTGMLIYRGDAGKVTNTYQTGNIIDKVEETVSYQNDSYGVAKTSALNAVYIDTGNITDSVYRKHEYVTFYNAPANVGYYLSGIGNGWENKMNHEGVPGGVANLTKFTTSSSDYEFQVWRYDEDHTWLIYSTPKTGGSSSASAGSTYSNRTRIASAGVWDITVANNGETFSGIYVFGSNYATLNFSILGGETYSGDPLVMGAGLAQDFPCNDGSIGANSYSSTQNKYYYDASIEVNVGDRFTIDTRKGSAGVTNAPITIASGDTATFISRSGGKNYYEVLTAGRYTIYLTYDDKIVLAPVPELGNGYYIMPSNTAKTLYTGFNYGAKMVTNSVAGGAYFTGYYSSGTQINFSDGTTSSPDANVVFFRSYVDGVDTHYTTINIDSRISSKVSSVDSNGIVRLKTGYYNIRISGSTVYISAYTVSDSFSLDPLVSGKTVENNYTSIVYEIEYRLSTTGVPVTLSCEDLSIGDQLDWAFFAPAERITSYTNSGGVTRESNVAPYYVMRDRYFDDEDEYEQVESAEIVASSTEESFYCYIIVDYKDGLSTLPLINTTTANFRITCTQVVSVVSSSASSIQIQVAPWKKEANQ